MIEEKFSKDLGTNFKPHMAVDNGSTLLIAEKSKLMTFDLNRSPLDEYLRLTYRYDADQLYSQFRSADILCVSQGYSHDGICLGLSDGRVIVNRITDVNYSNWDSYVVRTRILGDERDEDGEVTALYGTKYIAYQYGGIPSVHSLGETRIRRDRRGDAYGGEIRVLPVDRSIYLSCDEPVTLIHKCNENVFLFAGRKVFKTNQLLTSHSSALQLGSDILCVFNIDTTMYIVCEDRYMCFDLSVSEWNDVQSPPFHGVLTIPWPAQAKAVSACYFNGRVAVLDETLQLGIWKPTESSFIKRQFRRTGTLTSLHAVQPGMTAWRLHGHMQLDSLGKLCSYKSEVRNEFNIIYSTSIVRMKDLNENSVFPTFAFQMQDDSEEERAPRDAAGGGGANPQVGSKRREMMPVREEGESEDRFKAKRMAFVRQALQELTPEEREVLLTAPKEMLEEIYEETCIVCSDPLHKRVDDDGSEVPRKKPITSECEHSMCEDCETGWIRTKGNEPPCPKCRKPWRRATLEMLLLV